MYMASNYTDSYDGIASREPLSAEKVTAALNKMEKVANKVSKAEWEANAGSEQSSDSKYPTCAAVNNAVEAVSAKLSDDAQALNIKIDEMNFAAEKAINKIQTTETWEDNKSSNEKYPSCKVVNAAITEKFEGAEKIVNRVDYTLWDSNTDEDAKYPTCGAVTHAINLAIEAIDAMIADVNERIATVVHDDIPLLNEEIATVNERIATVVDDDILLLNERLTAVQGELTALSDAAERTANKVIKENWSSNKTNATKYPSCAAVQLAIETAAINTVNNVKTTSISSSSTDDKFPTAKAVHDYFWSVFH
ncbi:hypothetical protein NO1_0434 [Candidatus Termititenax aidoneus]|uniref:Uncharacterized protein n=1 Tax=Termititenax aidoneus TaxID=2218524 RepID=A0A388T9R7_TERA1|nr:hypothetical protein NO1_0434 [Candidatus Termititenax aidoneus]